jgi:steroid delta-isomerase-like uncharacterized protein
MDRIANEHFGYEAADDIDGVMATFSDDVTHHLVGSPDGDLVGKERVRRFYEELFAAMSGDHVEPVARHYGGDFLVDETLWTGTVADGRLLGLPGKSGSVTFRLLHVFEFRDGRIAREQIWPDTVAIAAALA